MKIRRMMKAQMILAQTNLPVKKVQMNQVLMILPVVMNPQAHQMNLTGPASQLQNMLDQIGIEISAKSQMQAIEKQRERKIEEGKDPDDDNVLNIG